MTMDDVQGQLKDITPLRGQLVPLRTFQEAHPIEETGEAFVAEIAIKSASKVVKLLDSKFPREGVQHLRRFAKPEFLPEYLRQRFPQPETTSLSQVIYILIPPPAPERTELEALLQPFAPPMIPASPSPTHSAPQPAHSDAAQDDHPAIRIEPIHAPLQPPTSQEQAQSWTTTLWPTMYNATARPASHSPPPMILAQTQASIEPHAGLYLSLARYVAREAQQSCRGRAVGVVVVDPSIAADSSCPDPMAAVVAVAGDARYHHMTDNKPSSSQEHREPYDPDHEGRPDHHAVMRAASMISHKRRCKSSTTLTSSSSPPPPPLIPTPTALESHFLTTTPLLPPSSGGYLCTSLDIYSTHEPCLCCAMGMLLSRFRAVVIPTSKQSQLQRSAGGDPRTRRRRVDASLDAESGYGLHWRAELNWRVVGFEFLEDVDDRSREVDEDGAGDEEGEFHP